MKGKLKVLISPVHYLTVFFCILAEISLLTISSVSSWKFLYVVHTTLRLISPAPTSSKYWTSFRHQYTQINFSPSDDYIIATFMAMA